MAFDRSRFNFPSETPVAGDSLEVQEPIQAVSAVTRTVPADEKVTPSHRPAYKVNSTAMVITGVSLLLIVVVGLGGLFISGRQAADPQKAAIEKVNNYKVSEVSVKEVRTNPSIGLGRVDKLSVNGQLKVSDTLILTPTSVPQSATRGQIYYDKNTNSPYYYNGTQFVSLAPQAIPGIPRSVNSLGGASGVINVGSALQVAANTLNLSNATIQSLNAPKVTSLQGQTGALSLGAGSGIAVNGLTVSNTGVTGLSGTANQISVSGSSGNVTLSLPQGIATTSSPTFSGLTLSSALSVANGGTGSNGSGFANGGVVYFDGTNLSTSATPGSDGLCLLSGPMGPVFTACPGGGAGISSTGTQNYIPLFGVGGSSVSNSILSQPNSSTVTLNNASAILQSTGNLTLAAAAGNNSITLTKTGTGNIVFSGFDCTANSNGGKLTTDASGNISCANDTGAGPAGATTALDNLAAVAINASLTPGVTNSIDLGSTTMAFRDLFLGGNGTNYIRLTPSSATGVRTITLPDASGTVCISSGNCVGASGGGVTSTGTTGYLTKFGATGYDLANSLLSESGAAITLNNAAATLQGSGTSGSLTLSAGGTNQSLILAKTGTGSIRLSGFDCTANSNGGKLTTDASGNISCANDTGAGPAGLLQVPTTTADNTVTPTANSVVGLTVNGTSGTAATAVNIVQGGAATGLNVTSSNTGSGQTINLTNTSGTQTNGLAITRNGAGTTTNLLNLTNTAGTATNAINIAGTFTNLISAPSFSVTNAGALTATGINSGSGLIQGTGGLTVTGATSINATTAGTTTIGSASAGAITLQSGSAINLTAGAASTISTTSGNLTLQGGSGTVTLGTSTILTSSGALAVSAGGTAQNLTLNASTSGTIAIGGTSTGNITIGGGGGSVNLQNGLYTGGTAGGNLRVSSAGVISNLSMGAVSGVLVTATTSGAISVAAAGSADTCFMSNGTSLPSFRACPAGSGWGLSGTAGTTGSNYLGTTDDVDLSIRTSGTERISVKHQNNGGNVVITIRSGQGTKDFLKLDNGTEMISIDTSSPRLRLYSSTNISSTALCRAGGTGIQDVAGCSGAPTADYAENYPVVSDATYGDIVAVGTEMVNTYGATADHGNVDWNNIIGRTTKLVKSTSAYQRTSIGIVSNNYNTFSSTGNNIKPEDNPKPVALNGRVLVNVSPSSDPISPGDYVTTSTDPGKAKKADASGFVIGKALEDWSPSSGKTQVMVFVEPGEQTQTGSSYLQNGDSASFNDLNVLGTATIQNLNVSGGATVGSLTVTGDATVEGTLTVETIKVGNIEIDGRIITKGAVPASEVLASAGTAATVGVDGNDTAGTITINTGTGGVAAGDLTKLTFSKDYGKTPKILITGQDGVSVDAKVYPKGKSINDFMMSTSQALAPNTTYTFDYFIVE